MNKPIALASILFSLTALYMLPVQPTKASSMTIVVPDDYPTIGAAIGNATEGDFIFVKSGTYHEHSLFINNTLTLMGENAHGTLIESIDNPPPWDPGQSDFPPPTPDAVQISANDVIISGFTITSASKGIDITGNGNRIISNIIEGLDSVGGIVITIGIDSDGNENQIIGNIIRGATRGIDASGSSQIIARNTVESSRFCGIGLSGQYGRVTENIVVGGENSYTGIELSGVFNVVYNNTVSGQGDGIIISSSGSIISKNNVVGNGGGIMITGPWGSQGSIVNNTLSGNTITKNRSGLLIQRGINNTVFANHIADNEFGVSMSWNQTTGGNIQYLACQVFNSFLYHNNFVNNSVREAVDWSWANSSNLWDNGAEGNYWSDYDGADVNDDGIGDSPNKVNAPYTIFWSSFGAQPQDPTVVNNASDRYPLMNLFNISNLIVSLPEWAIESLPSPPSLPSPSPSPSPSPLPTLSSSLSPTQPFSASPASPPSEYKPTSLPSAQPTAFPTELVYVAVSTTVVIALVAVVAAALRRRKRLNPVLSVLNS